MTVKIVTDSVADLPSQVVKELDITVISILVRWGEELYRDGIDREHCSIFHSLGNDSPAHSFTRSIMCNCRARNRYCLVRWHKRNFGRIAVNGGRHSAPAVKVLPLIAPRKEYLAGKHLQPTMA